MQNFNVKIFERLCKSLWDPLSISTSKDKRKVVEKSIIFKHSIELRYNVATTYPLNNDMVSLYIVNRNGPYTFICSWYWDLDLKKWMTQEGECDNVASSIVKETTALMEKRKAELKDST